MKIQIAKILHAVVVSALLMQGADALASSSKKALVLIDMQEPFITRGGNHNKKQNPDKTKEILFRQEMLIRAAKRAKIPIMVVEYSNFGETNKDLLKAIGDYKKVKKIVKNTDGLFSEYNSSKNEAVKQLADWGATDLVIAGANGGACVHETINGALQNKYRVWAYNRGIADFNYEDFKFPYYYNQRGNFTVFDPKSPTFKELDDPSHVYETMGDYTASDSVL